MDKLLLPRLVLVLQVAVLVVLVVPHVAIMVVPQVVGIGVSGYVGDRKELTAAAEKVN